VILDDAEESLLVGILPIFKELLEDVVAELVLGQLDALLDQRLEDGVLSV
jgi:hypothetical protein